jgi:Calcineurin-like phosphoesterase
MRTLIVSDLHLGSASRADLLRRTELRGVLFDALEDVDRLVLLGDVLELRHGPRREALEGARAFFEDLGRAFAGREVVLLAGNHDHALVEPWLERRRELIDLGPLALEQRFAAEDASPTVATLADWAAPARLSAAYPGLWVRPDVYATHGHYLDCHLTVPTMERLGIAAVGRMQRRPPRSFEGPEDYEAVTAPVFAWIDAMAQQVRSGATLNGDSTVRAWRTLGGDSNHRPSRRSTALRNRVLAGAFPLVVAALNRAGLGTFHADISPPELRRAGLRAMGEVAVRLGLGEAPLHVVFGHTHRCGPLPGDEQGEWRTPGGAQLLNSGCWTFDGYFLNGQTSSNPYWPGGAVLVQDEGPPLLKRLLCERSHAELAPGHARPADPRPSRSR